MFLRLAIHTMVQFKSDDSSKWLICIKASEGNIPHWFPIIKGLLTVGGNCAMSPTRITDRLPSKHDVKPVACLNLLLILQNIF